MTHRGASNSPRDVHARKMAQWSLIRQSDTQTWLAPMTEETRQRVEADAAILRVHRAYPLAIVLEVAGDSVTRAEPHQNVAEFLYVGYDAGVRAEGGKFTLPDGTTRTTIRMWYDAMLAIQHADQLRQKGV
jgi:hypothetical protein